MICSEYFWRFSENTCSFIRILFFHSFYLFRRWPIVLHCFHCTLRNFIKYSLDGYLLQKSPHPHRNIRAITTCALITSRMIITLINMYRPIKAQDNRFLRHFTLHFSIWITSFSPPLRREIAHFQSARNSISHRACHTT